MGRVPRKRSSICGPIPPSSHFRPFIRAGRRWHTGSNLGRCRRRKRTDRMTENGMRSCPQSTGLGEQWRSPPPVTTRRLSHAEYDNTIRDLIGVDLRPAREFPIDPANEAGFDNTGLSLTVSPSLMQKHLAAARHVSEHLVLQPGGFDFASHPVVTDTDRDKYAVRRIVDFYRRQPTDLADYFHAAWIVRVTSDSFATDTATVETAGGNDETGKGADGFFDRRLREAAIERGISP